MAAAMLQVRFCAMCGSAKSVPVCAACGADASGVIDSVDTLGRRLNWGAFLLPGLWPFWHGRAWMAMAWWGAAGLTVAGIVTRIGPAGGILAAGIAVYLLFYGNRIALRGRRFRDVTTFFRVERYWTRWGIAVLVLWILFGLAVYGELNAWFDVPLQ